jgi:hypothetical protein
MELFDVIVNNGEHYEDKLIERFIIGALNTNEAEQIALRLFREHEWFNEEEGYVIASPISETDNGISIALK